MITYRHMIAEAQPQSADRCHVALRIVRNLPLKVVPIPTVQDKSPANTAGVVTVLGVDGPVALTPWDRECHPFTVAPGTHASPSR